MTLENATQNLWKAHCNLYDPRKAINIVVDKIYNDHEAQLKAKDEEIKGLGSRLYHAEGYINDLHNNPKDKKLYDKKARSIVAMLFWEYKKLRYTSDGYFHSDEEIENAYCTFKKAYKMLKDNK